VNDLLIHLNLSVLKPILTALVMPPIPFLGMLVLGVVLRPRYGRWAVSAQVLALLGLWLSMCTAVGVWLEDTVLEIPSALSPQRTAELKAQGTTEAGRRNTAIVVLGSGREAFAPEYAAPNLRWASLERLRYGLWLSRQIGAPVGFSGGIGWAGDPAGATEADTAHSIAVSEFNSKLHWVESKSRDTRENAANTVALLKSAGITHIVLVTHGYHMARSLRNFKAAAGDSIRIEPAPMGLARPDEWGPLQWLPSPNGFTRVHSATREWLGLRMGA
jgi:uncharacterized SAM-binding protein YcdF (DUF218 family)